jgi:hypothetical protein
MKFKVYSHRSAKSLAIVSRRSFLSRAMEAIPTAWSDPAAGVLK